MEKLADIGVFGGSGFYSFLEDIEEIKKGYQIREIIENSILREMENVPDDIEVINEQYLAKQLLGGNS